MQVTSDDGALFDIVTTVEVQGSPQNLSTLPDLMALATVEESGFSVYLPLVVRNESAQ